MVSALAVTMAFAAWTHAVCVSEGEVCLDFHVCKLSVHDDRPATVQLGRDFCDILSHFFFFWPGDSLVFMRRL
jgi:hypothetical protein